MNIIIGVHVEFPEWSKQSYGDNMEFIESLQAVAQAAIDAYIVAHR